jgi:hypothetical protein
VICFPEYWATVSAVCGSKRGEREDGRDCFLGHKKKEVGKCGIGQRRNDCLHRGGSGNPGQEIESVVEEMAASAPVAFAICCKAG